MLILLLAATAISCPVVDLVPQYLDVVKSSVDLPTVKTRFVDENPDPYSGMLKQVFARTSFSPRAQGYVKYAKNNNGLLAVIASAISGAAAASITNFQSSFPALSCDFKIYVAPGFGSVDGAFFTSNGTRKIIVAPDTLAKNNDTSIIVLKSTFQHELFHAYRSQILSTSPDAAIADDAPLYFSMWDEGLASYVAHRLNPNITLADAIASPDLASQVDSRLDRIARDLSARLDSTAEADYRRYCVGGTVDPLVPSRAGYYIGYLVAKDLARTHSLDQLAHLSSKDVRQAFIKFLAR